MPSDKLMLSDDDLRWLIDIGGSAVANGQVSMPVDVPIKEARERLAEIKSKATETLELLIFCPVCKTQHVDVGKFATEPHKRHSCQGCGLLFSVTKDVPNIGVRFFNGCRDSDCVTEPAPGVKPYVSPGVIPAGMELHARLGDVVQVFKGPRD